MLLRGVAIWVCILIIANMNGAIREFLISPRLGQASGHVVSTILLCVFIGLIAWLAIPWIGPGSRSQAIAIGVLWLILTLAFEFLAGHYLFKAPWQRLLAEYNLSAGRIWSFVPIVTLVSPMVVWRIRQ